MTPANFPGPQRIDPSSLSSSVLDHIVQARRQHLPGIAALLEGVEDHDLGVSTRSLYQALGGGQRGCGHFIMECKSASPSLGKIRDPFAPAAIATVYNRYASAISVLCEPQFFGGSYDHLATVAASTHLPVLCKDFIIDPVQVRAARYFGADAILLMLSVLDDDQYRQLAALAAALGLDVLTEVSTESELRRARELGARIVGINNRNLRDLSIDTDRTRQYAPALPEDVVVVSESGIKTNRDVTSLGPLVSGFLVGSALMGQADLDGACRQLVFGNVKVCGLRTPAQAQLAAACGASFGGVILAPTSPRRVNAEQALEIIGAAPTLAWVAVVTTTAPDEIARQVLPLLGTLAAVQIHAPALCAEDGAFDLQKQLRWIEQVRRKLGSGEPSNTVAPRQTPQIWLGLSAQRTTDREAAAALCQQVRIVLDSGSGGTGTTFDWDGIPASARPHILLAGGIGPDNVQAARAQGTWGLDLNSRLEFTHDQHKDAHRVRAVFQNLRDHRARADQIPEPNAPEFHAPAATVSAPTLAPVSPQPGPTSSPESPTDASPTDAAPATETPVKDPK